MKNSKIEWTHHTFNPWWGCTKVSAGCKNCYACGTAKRRGQNVWGLHASRRFFGAKHWQEPARWNQEAKEAGERRRVFCASMGDVFEDRSDLIPEREKLWKLIADTPSLDWLLLTKRPQNIAEMLPESWGEGWGNVWLGTSAEDQANWSERLPHLMAVPAVVHFVSAEPLLGPIDLGVHRPEWIITGGESGPSSREIRLGWVREIRDECKTSSIAFFHKQWGGRDKHAQGRRLDGRTWDEFPAPVFPLINVE